MSATPRLAVVVVAARGGDRLARTLASAAWADELAVLAFGGPADPVAAAVRLLRDPTEIGELAAPWVLLLGEGDTVDVEIRRSWGDTLTDAVGVLDAEATVLAALVEPVGRSRRVVGRSGMALARALAARRVDAGPGLGRWILAVLEAYRVIVVYAKLWERRRNRTVVLA